MYRLSLLFSLLITLNAAAKINYDSFCLTPELDTISVNSVEHELEQSLFEKVESLNNQYLEIDSIQVIEIDEEVEFDFNPKDYLPANFNALKGKDDIDWSTIELIELDDEVELDFNPKDYLPKNFDAYKGLEVNTEVMWLY